MFSLASYEECLKSKKAFARNFVIIEEESNKLEQRALAEKTGKEWVIVNPSFPPLSQKKSTAIYDLPFTRLPHPRYNGKGSIPAYEMIKDSVTIHRGCFGGCSFCTISAHQGKFIPSRSKASILRELETIADHPSFKGHIIRFRRTIGKYVQDEGQQFKAMYRLQTAVMYLSCSFAKILIRIIAPLIELYREARKVKGVKKVTIGSGIRYDLILDKKNRPINPSALEYFDELLFIMFPAG